MAGQTIHDLLRGCRTIVVLGLQKGNGELQAGPPGTALLEPGDRVILMGEEQELERIRPAARQTPSP